MKKQETFTDIEYSFRKKKTKRGKFLEIMDEIIPWDEWVGVIDPTIPRESVAVRLWASRKYCGRICFRSGWKFGMKCHIGVDAGSGLVHTITVTAANEHDITQAAALIREDDDVVYGDSWYPGIQKRPEVTSNESVYAVPFPLGAV